ncbi:serine/threonine-protein kinase [Occultella aeris]|uniref:non-specific serine/threonine protein kinase n=1 Tax=Occultella aeris TaxID=2761496 RepID=A0A7M4DKK3_9MICO|nr:serine/threonine-protein kinase [Occultella aeris]VZO37693.1 Serine/threonine-protein kinase PknK [Occultella aeris]
MSDDDWAPAAPRPLAEAVGATSRRRSGPAGANDPTRSAGGPVDRTPASPSAVSVAGYSHLVEVATGGDSVVYRARQDSLDRDVAIKVIAADPSAAARFERELAITVSLGRQHPHIVNVLDTTTTSDGDPCLIMDFHDLGSLHDRVRAHGALPVSEVVAAGTAVADALAFAHTRGVLHRDVKPQNILLLPTSYVLSDFGIARMADAGHTASVERFSYRHASPQVLDGLPPTEADDVWSLASTLFTLLDGRAPFAALDPHDDTALSYLRRVRTGARRPLESDDLPAGLRDLIEAGLHADPARRPTAAQALDRLRSIRTEDRSWDPASGAAAPAAAAAAAPSVVPTAPSTPTGTAPPAGTAAATAAPPSAAGDAPPSWAPGTTGTDAPPSAASVQTSAPGQPPAAPEPAPQPSPLAPSVLAHVGHQSSPAQVDDGATGLSPEPAPEPPAGAPAKAGEGSGTTWRRIVAFVGGALLVGAAFGIGSALLGGEEEPDPTPSQTGVNVPEAPTDVQTGDAPPQPTVGNPDLAPVNPVLTPQGTSVLLTWAPAPSEVDYLLIVSVPADGSPASVLQQLTSDPGEYVVEGLDPDATGDCYAIVGYAITETGLEAGSTDTLCR